MSVHLRIGVVGASGYIGQRLCHLAVRSGHAITPFSRTERPGFRILPAEGIPDFSNLDAVVNLAGESILGFWTTSKKRAILESRIKTTSLVAEGMMAHREGPQILVNASAVGYYGDTKEQQVDENSPAGTGFLAKTCREWEAVTIPAAAAGVRVVRLRIGFVVGPGGAMRLMLPLFRLSLGGNLGNGRQWMSCIHVDDVAGMILWSLENKSVQGPVNAIMPQPVRNAEFTHALANAVHRPAILSVPAFAIRLALGELSHVMLDSIRAVPQAALAGGYAFRFSTLPDAFQALGNPK